MAPRNDLPPALLSRKVSEIADALRKRFTVAVMAVWLEEGRPIKPDYGLGCYRRMRMPASPWRTFRKAEQGRNYVALLCVYPLKSYVALPRFLRFTWQLKQQLKSARGLIGCSLLIQPMRKEFWTLSVWESEKTLTNFLRRDPHYSAMVALQPDVGPTQFIRWTIRGEAYPPRWDEASARATSPSHAETSPQPAWLHSPNRQPFSGSPSAQGAHLAETAYPRTYQ